MADNNITVNPVNPVNANPGDITVFANPAPGAPVVQTQPTNPGMPAPAPVPQQAPQQPPPQQAGSALAAQPPPANSAPSAEQRSLKRLQQAGSALAEQRQQVNSALNAELRSLRMKVGPAPAEQ